MIEDLDRVFGVIVGAVVDLVAAGSTDGEDIGVLALFDGGEKGEAAYLHGDIVLFFVVAEGTRHAATARRDLLDGEFGDKAEHIEGGLGADEGFLEAVAVNQEALGGGCKGMDKVGFLRFSDEEFIDQIGVFGDLLDDRVVGEKVAVFVAKGE